MPKRIEDLPLNYQQLYHEFSLEKDINEGLNSEIIIYPTNFEENKQIKFESLDKVENEHYDCDYDEDDENTHDMNAVSPYMRTAFGEFEE